MTRPDRAPPGRNAEGGPPAKGNRLHMRTSPPPSAEATIHIVARGSVTTAGLTGCPCGCRTKLPWIDDPDCIRHQPTGPARDFGSYDVIALGTGCSHQDMSCPVWRKRHGAA